METGEPYIMFEDAVDVGLPDFQKKRFEGTITVTYALKLLATDEERTAVCCLVSI